MQSRAFHRILAILVVGLFSLPAVAQYTRDNSANLKIDEAINNHYLMMELDKSESLLKGVVDACQDKCSPATKAKAWMYVGVVRGSGKADQAGAKEAFVTAKALDPSVQLDRDLASPETQATFDAVPGGTAAPTPTPGPAVPAGSEEIPGDMVCTPDLTDIQTRMPIPVSCTSQADVASAELRFKEFGADKWKKTAMTKVGEFWQAEVPCDITGTAGALSWYVAAKDAAGEYVDQYGSKKIPATFNLSDSASEAPSYPGKSPVARCADKSDCPPDFPGCASDTGKKCGELDWGASCDNSSQCQCGLLCTEGRCENAPSCTTDADCSGGAVCQNGTCAAGSDDSGPAGPFAKHWLSLDVGYDLVSMGGDNLCEPGRLTNYGSQCTTTDGTAYTLPGPGITGAGIVPGQLRLRLGYDFAITENLTVGARVGVGFMNTRPSFLPVTAEARVTYNFTSLAKSGIRPFVYVGGGLFETNGSIQSTFQGTTVNMYRFNDPPIAITPGVGLGYAINPNMAIKLDAMVVITVGPTPGFGVTPNLGFVYGI